MSFNSGRFGYSNRSRQQFIVRYRENGQWKTKFFTYENSGPEAQKRAMAFQSIISASPNVDSVTRVQVLYN